MGNWVLVPVSKDRVIKTLDKAVLIRIDYDHSTILPLRFKRKTEHEDMMFFSLPKDFKYNIRTTIKRDSGTYDHIDELLPLLTEEGIISYSIWVLRKPRKETDLPF